MSGAWSAFRHDPREHVALRAADADREAVHAILAEGYAEGRLSAAEHDDRTTALWRVQTLGELLPLIADLVPESEPAARGSLRRQLIWFLLPSLVCVLLWARASPHLFWPVWVMAYTGLPLLRTLLGRRGDRR